MPYIWRCQISYNGSGTFAINSTGQPVVAGTVISSTVFNSLTADLGTGLSTAITKDGQTTTTARILFAAGISSTLVTDATSISTGSILTLGGLGVTKAAWIGGLMNVAGAATFQSTIGITGALNATTINASGLVAMAAAATVGTTLAVTGTTTAAAINASGTVAMAGAATVGTTLGVTGTTTAAAINASGTVAMAGAATVGTTLVVSGVATFQVGPSVSGTLAITNTANTMLDALTVLNASAGNAASTRISLGNNTSGGAGQIILYGGNHATLPNYMDVTNANNALLRLQTGGGATSLGGTLSVTGTSTMAAINYSGRLSQALSPVAAEYALKSSGQTTGWIAIEMANTGGEYIFAGENSAGNNLITGDSAYDLVVRGPSGIAFSANAGSAMQMRLASTGLSVTGTLGVTGAVSSDGYLSARTASATPAGGSASLLGLIMGTVAIGITWGSGAPTLSAVKGCLYLRTDGSGTNDRMYINTNGSTTWTAVVTVS